MCKALTIGPLAVALALASAGCSVFGGEKADEPKYLSIEQDGDIEIRKYTGFSVAETTVMAPFDEATGVGFRRLFGYISGGNRSKENIEMTAPVLTEPKGERIAMTAPVLARPDNEMRAGSTSSLAPEGNDGWIISFVLPEGLTEASAPAPTDPTVTLRDVPPRYAASIRFAGRFRNATAEMKRQLLADWLALRGLSHSGDWQVGGYNPPWTIPALRRNEVLVTLQ